ncbi:polyphosphate kinase [Desulfuromusa kysingii]|uniref:Polyphosphate kinase n=1 Tax=Desulfuromusa kysingii TaxID=37625 RepID=A0A1H3ZRA5_9BACT|nr:polyphosphate kinase 1 [Desulfuromusa kysingii]SEA26293.1 polyphosphate kinase [Desulfuromusa kysingii]
MGSNVPGIDFNNPSLYQNRELSWLKFNDRVLYQAKNKKSPLLERVKFLAISGSNMDEFYMKRIGGLKQQVIAGILKTTVDGLTPQQQIDACHQYIDTYQSEKERVAKDLLFNDLSKAGIEILKCNQLTGEEQEQIREQFYDNIFPLITPQSIDPAHPFPFISNLSLNLFVTLRYPDEQDISLARVKVPVGSGADRFQRVNPHDLKFVLLEDLIENNLDLLFPGMEIVSCELFRVTRNANTSKDEEHADDLLELIETTLKYRRVAPIVRLQVVPDMSTLHRGQLAAEMGLDEKKDVAVSRCLLGLRDLWELYRLEMPELKEVNHLPIDHPLLTKERNIFHTIREHKEILLQHPYESFATSVGRFLYEAATDPKVRGIKMTLYRTDPDSEIINYLIRAAQNGKQVAVVVELKASFDEQANIKLASRMEEAGIHVTYGVVGLKTHAKVILVIRQDFKGLRRYVHIGTGNYHPVTSRLYSDIGIFIYNKDVGRDATELFNYLTTGFSPKRDYKKLLPAPKILKKTLIDKIGREAACHSKNHPGLIRFKMNALEDVDIVKALYRAAHAGVKVELLVRDSCRILPGIPGVSENVRVISIVGRFLEHARIYYFHNNGNEEFFIGSADAMKRNLEFRVEALVPVEKESLREQLREFMELQLHDKVGAWELQADGSYQSVNPNPRKGAASCQDKLIKLAEKRQHEVQRLRKRKSRQKGDVTLKKKS